jgi:hypothetical protein
LDDDLSFASFDDSIISTRIDPIKTLNEGIKEVKQEIHNVLDDMKNCHCLITNHQQQPSTLLTTRLPLFHHGIDAFESMLKELRETNQQQQF